MIPSVVIYYHDPTEVDPATSWTGLAPSLQNALRTDIRSVNDRRITQLFDYARPDAVISVGGMPIVSIEQTQMNPSGHNIPQRFSFHVRAAELCVPSILYYPEYSRRTFSDPNVRYLNVRVPLAQVCLSALYNVPALSIFWPTDAQTRLPDLRQQAHQQMAGVVDALVTNAGHPANFMNLPAVQGAIAAMTRVVARYGRTYRQNQSVRNLLPNGFATANIGNNVSIDPPDGAQLSDTSAFLSSLTGYRQNAQWATFEQQLRTRPLTLVYRGTANANRNDSEHPWPGYLTLLDILYARTGPTTSNRGINLVYGLPIDAAIFVGRANQTRPPTPTFIVDSFADVILLNGGVVAGRPLRGQLSASLVLGP